MDKSDIESSLRKINPRFVEEMTEQEKQKAIESFKKVYALQMSKASEEIIKRKKVYENLSQLKKQQQNQLQSIEDDLNQKMANFEKNRSKHIQTKTKEHKQLEQNWKKRWQTIVKKRRTHEIQNYQKAEKARKQTEEYFAKKHEFLQTSKSKKSNHDNIDESQFNYFKKSNYRSSFKDQRSVSIDQYKLSSLYKGQPLPTINRKTSSKKGFQIMNMTLNSGPTPKSKAAEIRFNREKFERIKKQKQEQIFQKMVNKLERIQKNRQNVQEKKEKFIEQAKKQREQKQNPEKLARNRQRSLDVINMRRKPRQSKERSIEHSNSKSRLDHSINQHREAKRLIEQSQFHRRQLNFQAKFQKIKKTKIDKIVKEAVHNLKHETLFQNRDKD